MSPDSRRTAEKQAANAGKTPEVLATDLDGTLIPLDGNDANRRDLRELERQLTDEGVTLVFVTGRHLEIVETAVAHYRLPRPDWIICDVGSTIYRDSPQGWQEVAAYHDHLASIGGSLPVVELRRHVSRFEGLTLQEDEKQRPFKLSFYADQSRLDTVAARVAAWLVERDAPWSMITSVDPFTGDGLLDLLPRGASKAFALEWWRTHHDFEKANIVFAGDSGNDWAALIVGYRSIVVANSDRQLADQIERHHYEQGWTGRLYLAEQEATSGVLAGCRWFGLIPPTDD